MNGAITCEYASGIVLNFEGTNTISATNSNGNPGIKCAPNYETTINVKSGTTTVTGGSGAAGIGAGNLTGDGRYCGNIVVNLSNGATLNATGGANGAGIGAGYASSSNGGRCGAITIVAPTATKVVAQGGGSAAGIGTGAGSSSAKSQCGAITITTNGGSTEGTTKPNVIAIGGSDSAADIGKSGTNATCTGNITIKDSTGGVLTSVGNGTNITQTNRVARNEGGTTGAYCNAN